jgi:protein N-terminal methyltransferase
VPNQASLFAVKTLPRVDALGSRQFLISLMPELCTVPSALRPLNLPPKTRRVRALDVGAGVGRVTSDTLLPLVDDVVVVEPVAPLIEAGVAAATAAESASGSTGKAVKRGKTKLWPGLAERTKSATFIRGTLQTLDPAVPAAAGFLLHRGGYDALSEAEREAELNSGFDIVWCQWCLGHLSDPDLVAFLGRAAAALRARNVKAGESESLVVIKENLCADAEDGGPRSSFDEQDSSLTRYARSSPSYMTSSRLNFRSVRMVHGRRYSRTQTCISCAKRFRTASPRVFIQSKCKAYINS